MCSADVWMRCECACMLRVLDIPRAPPARARPLRDRARGQVHTLLVARVGPPGAQHGRPPGRGNLPRARPVRPEPAQRIARLQRSPLEPRLANLRSGDHRAPEEVDREHPRRRLPPAQGAVRECGGRRAGQGILCCLTDSRLTHSTVPTLLTHSLSLY